MGYAADFVKPIPPENLLLTAHEDGKCRLWNYETGASLGTLICVNPNTKQVSSPCGKMRISQDGKYLGAKGDWGDLWVFDLSSGELLFSFNGKIEIGSSFDFSPSGKYVAEGKPDGKVYVLELPTGKVVYTSESVQCENFKSIWRIRWISEDSLLIGCSTLGMTQKNFPIHRWNVKTNQLNKQWLMGDIFAVSSDGSYLSYTADASRIYDIKNEKDLGICAGWQDETSFFHDNSMGVRSRSDKTFTFPVSPATSKGVTFEYSNRRHCLSSDDKYVAMIFENKVVLMSTATGKIVKYIDTVDSKIRFIALGLSASTIAPRAEKAKKEKEEADRKAREEARQKAEAEKLKETDVKIVKAIDRAFNALKLNQNAMAMASFAEAAELDQTDGQAKCVLGLLELLYNSDVKQAHTLFSQCVKSDMKNPVYLNNFGVTSVIQKKYALALTSWEKMAEIDAAIPELIQNVGILTEMQKTRKALLPPKELTRLIDLYGAVCTGKEDKINTAKGFKLMPLRVGAANRPDCDKYFVRKSRGKVLGEPFEIKR